MTERWVTRSVERGLRLVSRIADAAERIADGMEKEDMNVEISEETKEVALRELNILIDSTEGDDPDPLQDDVFQARDELESAFIGGDD